MRTGVAVPAPYLVLGGSGFVGRHVVARLVAAGHRVTVLTRRRAAARHLILLPTVDVVEGDPMDRATLARLAVPVSAVINLVGILHERGPSSFTRIHVDLPRLLVEACRASGVRRIVHLSSVGADATGGPSRYMRSKGEGEAVIEQSGLNWTILRPSIVFGREDRFINLFARLAVPVTAVINLVGILHERGPSSFTRVHVDLPRLIVEACKASGVRRIVHLSAVGADATGGPSRYTRSKGEGEAVIEQSGLDWTILRPSIVFGREDRFINLFARLARALPLIALAGASARFQPIYVRDVAACVQHVLSDDTTIGQRYSLCGPKAYTLRELVAYAAEVSGHPRPIVALGPAASRLQALVLEMLPGGLMSRDNLASMSRDNVCDGPFPSVFGFAPTTLEAVVPTYLAPDATKSYYDQFREHSGR